MRWQIRHIIQQCVRKRKLNSERQAKAFANGESRAAGIPISYYLCPICGSWHLTKRQ